MTQSKDKSKESLDRKKEYNRIYRENHREHYRELGKIYRKENKETIKLYYTENREEINAKKRKHYKEGGFKYCQDYHKEHREEETKKHKEWYEINRKEINKVHRIYRQTPKGMEDATKQNARHRSLGFIPFNERFDNSEAHHIDEFHVIHIPKDIHHSVSHSLSTGKNMDVINKIAFDFLKLEMKQFEEVL